MPPDAATDPQAFLIAVECPAADTCVSVGSYERAGGAQYALAETLSGGVWKPVAPPLPADAVADPDASLVDISCVGPSFCVAVGGYKNASGSVPLVSTWNGSTWSSVGPGLPAGATTTVNQPIQRLGRVAVDALLAKVKGLPCAREIVLPTRLVVRASCGCEPGAIEAISSWQTAADVLVEGEQ